MFSSVNIHLFHVKTLSTRWLDWLMTSSSLFTFTEDWRSEMVWTLWPVSGSHSCQSQIKEIKKSGNTNSSNESWNFSHPSDSGVFPVVVRVCANTSARIHWDSCLRRPWWAKCATTALCYKWRWSWLLFAGNGPAAPAASPQSDGGKWTISASVSRAGRVRCCK